MKSETLLTPCGWRTLCFKTTKLHHPNTPAKTGPKLLAPKRQLGWQPQQTTRKSSLLVFPVSSADCVLCFPSTPRLSRDADPIDGGWEGSSVVVTAWWLGVAVAVAQLLGWGCQDDLWRLVLDDPPRLSHRPRLAAVLAAAGERLRSKLLFGKPVAARLAAEEHHLLGAAVREMKMYRSCYTLQREEQGGTAESPKWGGATNKMGCQQVRMNQQARLWVALEQSRYARALRFAEKHTRNSHFPTPPQMDHTQTHTYMHTDLVSLPEMWC